MPPLLLGLALLLGLLALIPARRLARLGWSSGTVAAYFVAVWLLGVIVALAPAGARILVPVLLIAWVAPFVTWRDGLDRLRGRSPGSAEPPRNVTPPDDTLR